MPEPTDREHVLESQLAAANLRIAELTRHDPIYRAAIRHYGEVGQMRKALEELAELSVALHHWLDGKGNPVDVLEEIADVEVMCGQLRIVFGSDKVDSAKRMKLDRLVRRMGGE